jgi:hypothetical protein
MTFNEKQALLREYVFYIHLSIYLFIYTYNILVFLTPICMYVLSNAWTNWLTNMFKDSIFVSQRVGCFRVIITNYLVITS